MKTRKIPLKRSHMHTPWKRFKPIRHQPSRTWLVHVTPKVDGLMHWLVAAKTLDDAWKLALELPRESGTAPRLGGVIDACGWPAFMREKLANFCNECNHKSLVIALSEEHEWSEMALAFEEGYKEVIG